MPPSGWSYPGWAAAMRMRIPVRSTVQPFASAAEDVRRGWRGVRGSSQSLTLSQGAESDNIDTLYRSEASYGGLHVRIQWIKWSCGYFPQSYFTSGSRNQDGAVVNHVEGTGSELPPPDWIKPESPIDPHPGRIQVNAETTSGAVLISPGSQWYYSSSSRLIWFLNRQFTIQFMITVIPNYNVSRQRNRIRGFKLRCLITSNTYCWEGRDKFGRACSRRNNVSEQPSWGDNVTTTVLTN